MTRIYILFLFMCLSAKSQLAWPSESWNSALSLTSVMDAAGVTDLSGLHWNPETNRLYAVQGDGRLRVLQMNAAMTSFTQICNKVIPEGPEGITQVNYAANEFYTMDENTYEIRKFTHTASFSTVTLSKHWDLLAAPSPMTDTGNNGPEGIVFVPDSALSTAGFISQQTGAPYTSVKGMGGLLFVANQSGGYIWIFDVNPNVNNDFAYVGKYKTKRTESCDLSFDRSTGLLYILHNIDSNYVEVTNMATSIVGGERRFTTQEEYFIGNPSDGNTNVEGFAITPKCPGGNPVSVWLCRDVESSEDTSIQQDALRWFNTFNAPGTCAPLSNESFVSDSPEMIVFPNPAHDAFTISFSDDDKQAFKVQILNALGQLVYFTADCSAETRIDINMFPKGMYYVQIDKNQTKCTKKLLKN